ncbi:hypothetical protein BST61_g2924 [Cercospora zeina]
MCQVTYSIDWICPGCLTFVKLEQGSQAMPPIHGLFGGGSYRRRVYQAGEAAALRELTICQGGQNKCAHRTAAKKTKKLAQLCATCDSKALLVVEKKTGRVIQGGWRST